MTFERKIMRKLYGPTRTEDGFWRIKTNQEINDTLKGQNIIGSIKKQRLNWLGHVERMAEDNIVQRIKRWKPSLKDQLEDLKHAGKMMFWKIQRTWIVELTRDQIPDTGQLPPLPPIFCLSHH
jgi:hypothetical protein